MRNCLVQNEKEVAPLGIRSGVWLTVLNLALLCLLAINLSRRHTSQPAFETASSSVETVQDSSTRQRARPWRLTPNRAPEFGHEDAAWHSVPVTADEAGKLACRFANEKAKELYGWEPFGDGPPARRDETGWVWSISRGQGHADIEATVRFAADGSAQSVDVRLLLLDSLY
jgi:hypothetical protein